MMYSINGQKEFKNLTIKVLFTEKYFLFSLCCLCYLAVKTKETNKRKTHAGNRKAIALQLYRLL